MSLLDYRTRNVIEDRSFPAPDGTFPVGLDIGYSGVKGVSPNKCFCFPSYARKIENGYVSLKEPEPCDIVYRDSEIGTYLVGNLAYKEVIGYEVMDSEYELYGRKRYDSDIFHVLARTGLALALLPNEHGGAKGKKAFLQTGLPTKYGADNEALLRSISDMPVFEIKVGARPFVKSTDLFDGISFLPPIKQPMGALMTACFIPSAGEWVAEDKFVKDEDGRERLIPGAKTIFQRNVLVIDPGFGTTDTFAVNKGLLSQDTSETFSELGMRAVYEKTCARIREKYGEDIQVFELYNYLEKGYISVPDRESKRRFARRNIDFSDIIDQCSAEVCDSLINKLAKSNDNFKSTDIIIGSSGGFDAWGGIFKDALSGIEGLTLIPANHRDPSLSLIMSIAYGYFAYAASSAQKSLGG